MRSGPATRSTPSLIMRVTIYHVVARETAYIVEQGAAPSMPVMAQRVTPRTVRTFERQDYRVVLERAA